MKIRVILFGTLRKSFSDHDPVLGMEVEIPEGSTVGDLIAHIDLPAKKFGLVSVDGHLVKAGNLLQENALCGCFNLFSGGKISAATKAQKNRCCGLIESLISDYSCRICNCCQCCPHICEHRFPHRCHSHCTE